VRVNRFALAYVVVLPAGFGLVIGLEIGALVESVAGLIAGITSAGFLSGFWTIGWRLRKGERLRIRPRVDTCDSFDRSRSPSNSPSVG
jgi:hypothetical protein